MPNLPSQLLNSLSQLPGFNAEAFVAAHGEENRITSIRLNPFKKTQPGFELGAPVPWAQNAFYLDNRPSFTFDPLFHAGCYYVQEPGSMFIEFALKNAVDLSQPLRVLDLCAAPGGKSTLLNSLISNNSLLVANEFVRQRADVLVQNLGKWGTANTIVTNSDPQKFSALAGFFDVIVIDAPCSGSGLFRKQHDAIDEWSPEAVVACSIRQKKILEDALPALKEDGILIYSTCSYSVQENEDIVQWLQAEQGMQYLPLPVPGAWQLVETSAGYRFYPHLTASEGFFCAVLRKTNAEHNVPFTKKKNLIAPTKNELGAVSPFVAMHAGQTLITKNSRFHLLNQAAYDFLNTFEKQLYFKKAGTVVGELKGTDLVPDQELAWSLHAQPQLPHVELDKEQAIHFLRKDNFAVPAAIKGLALITHKGFGLGWAKLLPNRVNNYLPNELRILSRG